MKLIITGQRRPTLNIDPYQIDDYSGQVYRHANFDWDGSLSSSTIKSKSNETHQLHLILSVVLHYLNISAEYHKAIANDHQ